MFFSFVLLFFKKSKTENEEKKINEKMYLIMLASAIVSGGSSMLQLVAASYMPATVLYPLVTGGTIVVASVFDHICFGQKISVKMVLSIATCVLSLILFVLQKDQSFMLSVRKKDSARVKNK